MLLKTAKISNRSDWTREFGSHDYPLDWVSCPDEMIAKKLSILVLTFIKQAVFECYEHPTPGWALECYLGMPLMEEWQAVNVGTETEFAEYTDGMMCRISSKCGFCVGVMGLFTKKGGTL